MPERVLFVGGLARVFRADNRDYGACRVGDVVDGVGGDGYGAGRETDRRLERGEQHVYGDADDSRADDSPVAGGGECVEIFGCFF